MLSVLPENISNLIAAGEVVSRPASIVKELVENSIDAHATSVTVVITDSGRTAISVMDDGCGMSPDEALLCFERHATSKIAKAEDLESITTYGFRGEALPSIAAVAEVTLKTRRSCDETGFSVEMASSRLVAKGACPAPQGTSIEVRNVFYNVPARRKFLKSDATEMRMTVSEFLRVALIRPSIAMRLISDGKDLYNLRPARNLRMRVRDIFGDAKTRALSEVSADTSVIKVSGFIGAPENARKSGEAQYFFVNGRYFRSPYLHKAVCRPYEKLIPEGYNPSYFLFFETDPGRIDVNIHPAKTEVKFEDEQMVFEIVQAAVREALGRDSLIPAIDFDLKDAPEIPTLQSTVAASRQGYVAPPKINYDPLFDPFSNEPAPERMTSGYFPRLFNDPGQSGTPFLTLAGKYIITRSENGLKAVSVTRARERIFYERYLEMVAEEKPLTAHTLFPQSIDLSVEDAILLGEEAETVASMGFDLKVEGGKALVRGLPEGFPSDEEGIRRALDSLLAALRDDTVTDDYRQHLAAGLARSAALSRGKGISDAEAESLLASLRSCRCPSRTADGLPVEIEITIDEIDKKL